MKGGRWCGDVRFFNKCWALYLVRIKANITLQYANPAPKLVDVCFYFETLNQKCPCLSFVALRWGMLPPVCWSWTAVCLLSVRVKGRPRVVFCLGFQSQPESGLEQLQRDHPGGTFSWWTASPRPERCSRSVLCSPAACMDTFVCMLPGYRCGCLCPAWGV